MRICSPQIGIDPESNLGGGVYDREILKALAAQGVQVTIPLPDGEPHDDVDGWEIVPTVRHRWKYYEYNLIFRRAVRCMIHNGRRFDWIRAHNAHSVGLGLLGVARRNGIPFHLHYHHWERHRLRNMIERYVLPRADLVTVDSDFTAREIRLKYGLRNRVEVVYPGVSSTCWLQSCDRNLREVYYEHTFVLLSVGALIGRKNHALLIDVMARLKRPDVMLLIVGDGPGKWALQNRIHEAGLHGQVKLLGRVCESRKRSYYDLCDLCLHASTREGFGMAPLEAMSFGKPVVALNNTSLPEVVLDGETGILCEPTVEDFARGVESLLNNELRRQMGAAARRRSADFTFERSAGRLRKLYEEGDGNESAD